MIDSLELMDAAAELAEKLSTMLYAALRQDLPPAVDRTVDSQVLHTPTQWIIPCFLVLCNINMRLSVQSTEQHFTDTNIPGSARELSCRWTAPWGRSTRHVKVCSFAARITTGVGMEMPARHKSRPDASAKVEPAAAVASNMAAPGSRQRPATMWSIRYDSAGCASCVMNLRVSSGSR